VIDRGDTLGEVMWKGEAKRPAPGGTQKERTCRTPMVLGAGAAASMRGREGEPNGPQGLTCPRGGSRAGKHGTPQAGA